MKAHSIAAAAFAALAITACGGGAGGGGVTAPTSAPTIAATATPPTVPASQPQFSSVSIGGTPKQVLVSTANQHTLYTFGADTANTSNCTSASGCTTNWPPYTAPAGTSASSLSTGFGLITRSDGSLQYTYQSFPLYTFSADSAAGTANGQGANAFGGIWYAAQQANTATPGATATPPSSCIGYYC
jgi:predicted lipoprotein with Yx(FWY)xxD motif